MISTAVWKTLLGLPPFPQARRFIFNLYLIQGGGPNQSIKVGQIKLSKPPVLQKFLEEQRQAHPDLDLPESAKRASGVPGVVSPK
jgi:hypothetical protein